MDDIANLKQRVELLEKLVILKILGNDTSTNYGLPAQTILYGLQQAGALSLTKNGVRTTINNDIDPDFLGEAVSLEAEDVSVPNGDKSGVSSKAFLVLAWDGAAYQVIATIGDNGAEAGNVTLTANGTSHNITLDASNPLITITDGINTSALLHNGIIVDNAVGINGVVVAGAVTMTFHKGILVSVV